MDSNQTPIILKDIESKYKSLISEINNKNNNDNNDLILWIGLKQLYCTKQIQNIKYFPSDLVWCNKTKNLFLLELERAINDAKWREWLHICYDVIVPINKNDIKYKIKMNNNNNIPQFNETNNFQIKSDSQQILIPFLIKQILNDTYLENNIMNKLTKKHSQKILNQFIDRIKRSDIKYNVHKRNKFLNKNGNKPLYKYLFYDYKFTEIINKKLNELNKIDADLSNKFKESWSLYDKSFRKWTTNQDDDENNSINIDENEAVYYDANCESFVSVNNMDFDDNDSNNNNNNNINDLSVLSPRDKLIYKSLSYFRTSVPSSYCAHYNLHSHTIDDCNKLIMLNPSKLSEGYTGDSSNIKYGLWKANNLPIIVLRPHLLKLRDILIDPHNIGAYIEISGKYGSGKSIALMYAVNIIRNNDDWLCIYQPNTNLWVQKIEYTVPSNTQNGLFYQHWYAKQFFNKIKISESNKLKNIKLQNQYSFNKNQNQNDKNNKNNKIDINTVYSMLEDPTDLKKYESSIINEWMKIGASHTDNIDDIDDNNDDLIELNTLYDLVEYGCTDCKYPASLMYDFFDEIKKQNSYKILIACDNINYWNNFIYGLSTPRNPKVFAWQLSMIDIFSQFQQINSLSNGIVIMSHTTEYRCRTPQFKTNPSHIIKCPDVYTNDEFDAIMWNYKGIKLLSPNIAPDDYKKVFAASGKKPVYTQRIASLY